VSADNLSISGRVIYHRKYWAKGFTLPDWAEKPPLPQASWLRKSAATKEIEKLAGNPKAKLWDYMS